MIRKTNLFVICLLLFSFSQIRGQSSVKAIVGGTLVNPGGGASIKNSVVIIEGNKIIKVGKKMSSKSRQAPRSSMPKENGSFPV